MWMRFVSLASRFLILFQYTCHGLLSPLHRTMTSSNTVRMNIAASPGSSSCIFVALGLKSEGLDSTLKTDTAFVKLAKGAPGTQVVLHSMEDGNADDLVVPIGHQHPDCPGITLYIHMCVHNIHVCSALRAAKLSALQVSCLFQNEQDKDETKPQHLQQEEQERRRENTNTVDAPFVREKTD